MQKFVLILSLLFIVSCSSAPEVKPPAPLASDHPAIPGLVNKPALALVPKAKTYNGENTPVIQQMLPKSVADKYGFKIGDLIMRLNNTTIITAGEFEQLIRHAAPQSIIVIKRGNKTKSIPVHLGLDRPRFGAGFEPERIALKRGTSPYISFMHNRDLTAFAETSINEGQTDLRVNVILQSTTPLATALVKYTLYDQHKVVGTGREQIYALGSAAKVFNKAFHKNQGFKGPIQVALDIEGRRFHFEFQ
jgi:hypothetical protein